MPWRTAHIPLSANGRIGTNTPAGFQAAIAAALTIDAASAPKRCHWTRRGADPARKYRFETTTLSPLVVRASAAT